MSFLASYTDWVNNTSTYRLSGIVYPTDFDGNATPPKRADPCPYCDHVAWGERQCGNCGCPVTVQADPKP